MQVQRACRAAISQNAAQKRHHVISTRAFAHNLRNFPQVSEKKNFSRKAAKAQSAAAFLRVFLCAFAPLRLCAFAPLRLCGRKMFRADISSWRLKAPCRTLVAALANRKVVAAKGALTVVTTCATRAASRRVMIQR